MGKRETKKFLEFLEAHPAARLRASYSLVQGTYRCIVIAKIDYVPPKTRPQTVAFRKGTQPNTYLVTLAQARRCVAEVDPFHCHKGMKDGEPTQLCRGWLALVFEAPGDRGDAVRAGLDQACEPPKEPGR